MTEQILARLTSRQSARSARLCFELPPRCVHLLLLGALIVFTFARPSGAIQVQDETKIELSGFSLSEAFTIEDGNAFELEQTQLLRLVYRLWQTTLVNLDKYSQYTSDVDWEKLFRDPPGYRLQVFEVVGRARSVERLPLPNAEEDPLAVYRIQCVSATGQPFEILSLQVPQVWLKAVELDQPVSALGFFYAMIRPDTNRPETSIEGQADKSTEEARVLPLFLAKQVSWTVTEPNSELGIELDQVWLAQHGVDLAAFDLIRREDRRPMGAADARSFYQFLQAVQTPPEPSALRPLSHMELLRSPSQSHGRLVSFRARVKKCSIVRPSSSEAYRPAELESYYQLIVFPDLRDSRDEPTLVEIGRGDEKQTYRRFPFTVCCRDLPIGMTPTSIENQQVWIEGFFYRFWLYEAERTNLTGVAGQISPIIIANHPQVLESSLGQLSNFFNSLLLIFLGVLAIVGWTIFRISKRRRSRQEPLPEKLDVQGLEEI